MTFGEKIVLHIGAPKTATTSLEENLYENHSGICNVGRPFSHGPSREDLWAAIKGQPTNYAQALQVYCEQNATGRPIVMCDDAIHTFFIDDKAVPTRLREVFGPARILVTIRNQMTAIQSSYLGYNQQAQFDFSGWIRHRKDFLTSQYDYDGLLKGFEAVFGKDRIGIFLFEDLQKDAGAFARSVCRFLEVDENEGAALLTRPHQNPRISQRTLMYQRFKGAVLGDMSIGSLLPEFIRAPIRRFLLGGAGAKVEWNDDQKAEFSDVFCAGNRAVAERYGLKLAERGYPT